MRKKREQMNLATEILCQMKRQLYICRAALAISMIGNVILAIMLFK